MAPTLKIVLLTALLILPFSNPLNAGVHVDSAFRASVSGGPVNTLAIDADGSVLIGGDFNAVKGLLRGRVARLNADGGVENGFGLAGANAAVHAIVAAPDGDFFLGGRFSGFEGANAPNITGTHPDFNPGNGPAGGVNCLAVDGQGNVILGGSFQSVDGNASIYIARLSESGVVDSTFAPELNSSRAMEAGVSAVAIQADGKILVGGVFETEHGFAYLVRLNENGSLDSTFAADHGSILYTKAIVPLGNGQVLIAGQDRNGKGFVRRLNSDRSVDASFAAPEFEGAVNALAVDAHGRIIAGGRGIARLKVNGGLDDSWDFNVSGVVNAIAMDANENIVVAGSFALADGSRFGVVRLIEAAITSFSTNTNTFRGTLKVTAGRTYVIQSSTDLLAWTDLDPGVGTTEGLDVVDRDAAGTVMRFFRARLIQ